MNQIDPKRVLLYVIDPTTIVLVILLAPQVPAKSWLDTEFG